MVQAERRPGVPALRNQREGGESVTDHLARVGVIYLVLYLLERVNIF